MFRLSGSCLGYTTDKKTLGSPCGHWSSDESLQVATQPLNLINEEVNVGLGGRRVGDDHTEEVDFIALRLVAHHGGPGLHHHGLDLWCYLVE